MIVIALHLTPTQLRTLQVALFARAAALKTDFIANPNPESITELEAIVSVLMQTAGTEATHD
jgi:hypothetical protein